MSTESELKKIEEQNKMFWEREAARQKKNEKSTMKGSMNLSGKHI